MNKDPGNEGLQEVVNKLHMIEDAHHRIAVARLSMVEEWNQHNELTSYDHVLLQECQNKVKSTKKTVDQFSNSTWSGSSPFDDQFATIDNVHLPELRSGFEELKQARHK